MQYDAFYRDRLREFAAELESKRRRRIRGRRSTTALSRDLKRIGHEFSKNEISTALSKDCPFPRIEVLDVLADVLKVPRPMWWPITHEQVAAYCVPKAQPTVRGESSSHLSLVEPADRFEFQSRLDRHEREGGEEVYVQTDWCIGLCQDALFLEHRLETSLYGADEFDQLLDGYLELARGRVDVAKRYDRVTYVLPTTCVEQLAEFINECSESDRQKRADAMLDLLNHVQGRVLFIPRNEERKWLGNLSRNGVINYLYLPPPKRGVGIRLKRHADQTITIEDMTSNREADLDKLLAASKCWGRPGERLSDVVRQHLVEHCELNWLR